MKKILFPVLFCAVCVFIWACKKNVDWNDVLPGNPKDTSVSYSGWSMSGNGIPYKGCIDTAYFSKIDTVKLINIGLSDSAGNSIRLTLIAPSGIFKKGAYSTSEGTASIVVLTSSGNYTTTGVSTAFTIEVTAINDTLVEGIFAASLVNPVNNGVFTITNGKIRAIIGRGNTCSAPVIDSAAVFTLESTGPGCTSAMVQGAYTAGSALSASNMVTLQVRVASIGTYTIATKEVNGVTFFGAGSFMAKGLQTVTLQGMGTPLVSGTDSIPITAGSSNCKFGVTVQSGFGPNATFTAAANLCDSATVQGTYTVGAPLNSGNKAIIKLNVSTPGAYTIYTATENGITFSGTGAFASAGVQNVTLTGSGTPTTDGINKIPISIHAVSCSLNVRVDTPNVSLPIPVNTWVFTEGANAFAGPITVSTFGADIITGKSLQIVGNALDTLAGPDTTFQLYIQLPSTATAPVVGVYPTDPSTFSSNTTDFNLRKGDVFSANKVYYSKTGAGAGSPVILTISILSYDNTKKIVQGRFSGSVWNKAGAIVTIANGMFKAEVR